MKRIKERLCSIMLCVAMIAGLVPINAAALEIHTPAEQIGNHYRADDSTGVLDAVPELSGDTSKNYAEGWVRTNKTISPGENENEFIITLEVRTKTVIENIELSEDAAVVLVIDLSASMTNNNSNKLQKAKEAALAFIEKFAVTDNENTLRKIAVVGFSGQQETGGRWNPVQKGIIAAKTYQPWTDAYDSSISAEINKMKAEGGTCLQAGLILAKNLLNSTDVADIANKNIVVLTDGCPTYYLDEEAEKDTSVEFIGQPDSILGSGSSTDHNTHTKTENTAKSILQNGINVYSIYLGSDKVNCNSRGCSLKNKTGADWLREYCGFINYAVDNADKLLEVFESISELIQLQTMAWIAEDPMGEMFDFTGFVKEPEYENEYYYNASDKKIHWNLRLSAYVDDGTEEGVSIYRLAYKIRLNTLNPDYEANVYYPTNGITSVTWLIEKSTESGAFEIDNGTAYFNVPSAKGYAADIRFQKTDGDGQPLAGAEFVLYHDGNRIKTAVSKDNGEVLFENVPSGHSYTIAEESAPEGFVASAEKYDIKVAYGNLNGTIGENNTVINIPEIKYGSLTISKTIHGPGANPEDEFTFTVTLSDTGLTGTCGDLEFTDGVATFTLRGGQSVTASGLPAGTGYTVTESEKDGYVPSVNGEEGSTVSGTIQADAVELAAFENFYDGSRIDPDPEYGGFIISKTISGNGALQTDEFTFKVTLDNNEISGNYGNINFVNGVATFTLRGGQSVTASELPAGTGYTVEEIDSKGYTVTVNGENRNSVSGVIVTGELMEIGFNNYSELPPDALEISKKLIEADGWPLTEKDKTTEFVYIVTFTELYGQLDNIPYWKGPTENVNIDAPRPTEADKIAALPEYLIRAEGEYAENTFTFTLKGDETIVIYGLPIGTKYTVSETRNPDYPAGGDTEGEGIYLVSGGIKLSPDEEADGSPTENHVINEVTFINVKPSYESGILAIEKQVIDEDKGDKAFGFTVTLTVPSDEAMNEIFGVNRLSAKKWMPESKEPQDFAITWERISGDNVEPRVFEATFTLMHNEKIEICGIPCGSTFTVAESDRKGYNLQHVYQYIYENSDHDNTDIQAEDIQVEQVINRENSSVSGTVTGKQNILLVFENSRAPFMPFSGGVGKVFYVGVGTMALLGSSLIFFISRKKYRSCAKLLYVAALKSK